MSTVVKIERLSKRFFLNQSRQRFPTLRDALTEKFSAVKSSLLRPRISGSGVFSGRVEEFWALKDISFAVDQGERIGIIGPNGAGKSTLLKILSRITEPTTGRISLRGRMASLLEVGTGFHPELTGRENIYLNGAILGMTRKEIRRKFDEIVAFAEVENFLDTPVKRYSSGMYVRLAFAIAAHLESEILIVDEVLAVGDVAFQKKCLGKMEDVGRQGRTIFYVSHNMGSVKKLCTKVMNLNKGEKFFFGDVGDGIQRYLSLHNSFSKKTLIERLDRKGRGHVRLYDCCFVDDGGNETDLLISGERLRFKISYVSSFCNLNNVWFRFILKNSYGEILFVCNNLHSNGGFNCLSGSGEVFMEIEKTPLFEGVYTYDLQVVVNKEIEDAIENAGQVRVETGDFFGTGIQPSIKEGLMVNHVWKTDIQN
ncbi:ABC transporter ATP-binding protein [Geothermobacter hydrogeniphilus]|uniref:ABC transporter ATP-binding protein n=1 Tax=Geothermobacter hydrogeniphilus TaxID=1969733 RepID=A0A2K2H7K0_9BACT|nr:ABC transporter ATP-binding protein [Geothermobacter hydrogeniphilus]PNU19210.1 ABC transporter ATP-binding protein [Geothermobacter hydrogeniphilus]